MTGLQNNPSAKLLASYGCDAAFWRKLRNIGLEMVAAGASKDCGPLRAFQHQRHAALVRRKIAWQMTLPEWWAIWSDSGHWGERGLGRGYMMCRIGDKGPYAVGNVFVGPGVENLSAAAKKCDLPIGVSHRGSKKNYTKPYRAYCNLGGKQRHLGTYLTVDEARAAYLAALAIDTAMTGSTPSLARAS